MKTTNRQRVGDDARLFSIKTKSIGQLIAKQPNYCVDIRCLGSNISTYIHCLGSY